MLFVVFAIAASVKKVLGQARRSADNCGVAKINRGLIVGGRTFSRGKFPWIVALMNIRIRPAQYFCGGTLISSDFVISGKYDEQICGGP